MSFIFYDFTRSLRAPAAVVRTEILSALRTSGFRITTEQLTIIEARRGSEVAMAFLQLKKVPITLSVQLNPGEGGCGLAVRMADRLISPRMYGVNNAYEKVFEAVRVDLDARFSHLDPSAELTPAAFSSRAGNIGFLERTNNAGAAVGSVAGAKVVQKLEGGPKLQTPQSWKDVDGVVFSGPHGSVAAPMDEVQAQLTIARLIATQPGSMPPKLAGDVEQLAARIESTLATQQGAVTIPISDEDRPVVEFLHQQARIREMVPARMLHSCRTCKFQRVTNPDYERLMKRNQKLRALGGGVGATFGKSGISPFVVLGTVFKFARLDPDYVCQRCQGTDAEERLVTFCPGCGAMRSEAALRTCEKCSYDFRKDVKEKLIWTTVATVTPLPLPAPAQAVGISPAEVGGTAALDEPSEQSAG